MCRYCNSFIPEKNSAPNQYREVIQTKSLRQNDAPPPVTHSGGPSSEASSALQWPPDAPPCINDLSDYKCSTLSWFIFRFDMKLNLHLSHLVKQWINRPESGQPGYESIISSWEFSQRNLLKQISIQTNPVIFYKALAFCRIFLDKWSRNKVNGDKE